MSPLEWVLTIFIGELAAILLTGIVFFIAIILAGKKDDYI